MRNSSTRSHSQPVAMDAIRDIENHPAFARIENEDIVRKRLEVLEHLRAIKKTVARFDYTERPSGNGFQHYKECWTHTTKMHPCPCHWLVQHRYHALLILDKIKSME